MNETCKKLKKLMNQRGWTLYRLAAESGLAYSSVSNLFNRNTEPTLPTLRCLCKGLGISLSEFFSDEPVPIRADYTLEEEQLVINYRSLRKADKGLLSAYLSGLCKIVPTTSRQ
ncbi:MAG: helix-turn-helix domain-containing protein [Lachnospiraceae bacterium]|nr:helix-turn-helix domain-containing protein [Lachnospiraceae bacterium]